MFRDTDGTVRGSLSGRALKRKGKMVKHHKECEAKMCDGRPYCRRVDEHGGAWLIETSHPTPFNNGGGTP